MLARSSIFLLVLVISLLWDNIVLAQRDSLSQRIILIGDAGEQQNNVHPELEFLKKTFPLDKRTTVIFLGDNVYPLGLPSHYASNYAEKKQVLDSQINVVLGKKATAYFIAGNHDWMQGAKNGYQQVLNQYNYITSLNRQNVHFVPDGACPGPQEIAISDKVTLVVIDSQWWLHKFDKPTIRSGCENSTEAELLNTLQEIVTRNEDKLLIFAAHHPFITFGRHGGYYNLKQHIFPFTDLKPNLYIPLPVLGSIYPIARGVFGNIQDTKHPIYKNFSRQVDSILSLHPNCIRVAGHEHNLQLIKQGKNYYVVSGAGAKQSEITKDDRLKFSSTKNGFAMIEVMKDDNVYVKFYSSETDTSSKAMFTQALPPIDSSGLSKKTIRTPVFPDSVKVIAASYYKAGKFKKWLLGANYRNEWTEPVRVKVFDIGKEAGGLKVTKKGGGMQTKSLRLEDKKGKEYALRSVEKFPDATLPEEFRQTVIKDAIVDGISASYPFAALSIPLLSQATGVPYAIPRLVYIPDDPRFGYYQKEFANTLAIFEEREPNRYGENKSTEKIVEKIREDNDDHIDQKAVLKARLLDMFIMDFDRHEDQWRWNTKDTGKGKLYYPLPRDRDQAFFVNMGQIPKMIRKPYRLPKFQGFRPKAINIKTFNFNARYFDRTFLNEMLQEDWEKQADTLIAEMTDSVIEAALKKQPPEIFAYSGPKIIQTLKERRKYIKDEAKEYYKFLAKEVEITGTDKKETFEIVNNDDGSVNVKEYKINDKGERDKILYERKFLPDETHEIRLFGFNNEDTFHITGTDNRLIKIRLLGGEDKDVYINDTRSRRKLTVTYDYKGDSDLYKGVMKKEIPEDPAVNTYNRRSFQYDILQPKKYFAYNRDDGLFVGIGLKYTSFGFRKDPFRMQHELGGVVSLLTKAWRFRYDMTRTDAIGGTDLLFHADVRAPNNTINFFGQGNNTINRINDGRGPAYYRTRFFHADLAMLLRREIFPDINLYYGPTFQFYNVDSNDNKNRVILKPAEIGLDTTNFFRKKYYGGFTTSLVIDNRNDVNYPTRGVLWKTSLGLNRGLTAYTSNYSSLSSDMSVYISSNAPARMVVAVRFGAAFNFGKYEFYQSQFLSGLENLRGYRKNRFAGDRMMYNNIDMRIRIKNYQGYLFTGSYGVLLFHDVGRVWLKNEHSGIWHTGYGGGLWLSPANRIVFTGSLMHSKEGWLPLVSLGFQF
ncbi:MAG TPA: BamA/TamA family outer membrane protein [Flavitalea sp.]|nr:BamA/TamA family outer membrane protein [Flavitalea sp.]